MKYFSILLLSLAVVCNASATDYNVGPGQTLTNIADVPWASLQAGDHVYIHWRRDAYREKWVINRQGTAANPIVVSGVANAEGLLPIISGENATTPEGLNFWNDPRGIIKIGGSSIPEDGMPAYITIENLEIRSARPGFNFTDDKGNPDEYVNNAAAIYVEKAQHLIILNCKLHDCGNGIFIGAFNGETQDILIDGNYIYNNGIEGRFYEHNTYTEAIGIVYQFNRFGPLRSGADGNNLKDRSAGLVVRYNWIEGGNRQLDLVDAQDSEILYNHPSYATTHVYGNVLIEPDGDGNSQIVHYGGDSQDQISYRKGDLYFYNNTVVSHRSGNTTLLRLSSESETAHVFNNAIYSTASGNKFAMINGDGTFNMHHNWLKTGWVDCHCSPTGSVEDQGNNLLGDDPDFVDFDNQDFHLSATSRLIDSGSVIPTFLLAEHDVSWEYVSQQDGSQRQAQDAMDIGAFEYQKPSRIPIAYQAAEVAYPNPFVEVLHLPKTNFKQALLRDITGKLVLQTVGTQLQTESIPNGIYTLEIVSNNGKISYSNVVKR